jgi:hypothetical protein
MPPTGKKKSLLALSDVLTKAKPTILLLGKSFLLVLLALLVEIDVIISIKCMLNADLHEHNSNNFLILHEHSTLMFKFKRRREF